MVNDVVFTAWNRPSIDSARPVPDGARRRLALPLTATLTPVAGGDETVVGGEVTVELPGPGDVAGLAPGAIRRVRPPAASGDAEEAFCVYADLLAADLPWRYTAAEPNGVNGLRPWLAVVAGAEGTEVGLDAAGRAWMSAAVATELDPRGSAAWGHVHYRFDPAQRLEAARVLCPRRVPPNASCLAVVVPLYQPDGKTLRWSAGRFAPGLPVLYAWRFRTNEAGTFLDLAAALKPAPIPDGLGVARVTAVTRGGRRVTAPAFGLLAPIGVPAPGGWSDPTLLADVEARLAAGRAPDRRPVLGPPLYASPWVAAVGSTTWGGTLNHDPRHRAVAALGTRAGIEWQREIIEAASVRLGQTHLAAVLLRDLTTGVELAVRLQRRRPGGAGPAGDPAVAAERLAFYGPGLRKARAEDGATALSHLTGPRTPLAPAVLSAAALRLLRPGGAPARYLHADQRGGWSAGAVIAALNRCREAPGAALPPTRDGEPGSPYESLAEYLDETGDDSEFGGRDPYIPEDLGDLTGEYDIPEPPCRPVEIGAAVGALDAAFDPLGLPVEAALDRISPRPARYDRPYVVEPDLDLPAWAWLRDRAPEWLLPRADLVEPNAVVALRTNGAFLESFLIGLSQQTVAELRWRGVPCAPGAVPMRTLWQRVRPTGDGTVRPDLAKVADWHPATGLDHPDHRGGDRDMLVILLRSEILRRYPDTVIRLLPRRTDQPDQPDCAVAGTPPAAVGPISADLWFLAFDIDPGLLGERFVVLEETVDGPRFAAPDDRHVLPSGELGYGVTANGVRHTTAPNGADYAAHAWERPVRAAIDGRRLAYDPPVIGGP